MDCAVATRRRKNIQPSSAGSGVFIAALFMAIALVSNFASSATAGEQKRLNVLELYTSQGCSSCPPADRLLGELSKHDDLLALSFPVSYWDHLGWRDTLAKEAFNERQRLYAEASDRKIYTPQVVVNGLVHTVGSQKASIEAAVAQTSRALEAVRVPVSVNCRSGAIELHAGDAPAGSDMRSGRVWLATYSHLVKVDIGQGENTGREITYTNVVRQLVPAGRWSGQKEDYKVELPQGTKFDACAALLQADKTHAVLGADMMALASK
jgi:hypothetical protein